MRFAGLPEGLPEQDFKAPAGESEQRGFVSTEFTVHCGGCLEWDRTSAVSRRKAGVAWKDAGWRFTRKRGWLCPTCMKRG